MNLLNYKPLKDKLRSRSLSDREAFPYVIAGNLIIILGSYLVSKGVFQVWDWIGFWSSLFLSVFGTFYWYRKNGGKQGVDFIQKITVLSVVCSIRSFLFFLILIILLIGFFKLFAFDFVNKSWHEAIISVTFQIFIYYRVGVHISDVAKSQPE